MADNETTADVISWLRRPIEGENGYLTLWRDEIADRLEAAHKRELSKNTSKNGADFGQLGDAAKLREALSDACYAMFNFLKTQNGGYEEMASALDKAKAALAAPARNCNVGTAEEQAKRFKFSKCDEPPKCRPWDEYCLICFAKWAQMPYVATEGGAK